MKNFSFVVLFKERGKKKRPFIKIFSKFSDFENDSTYKNQNEFEVVGFFPVKKNRVDSFVELCQEYINGNITFRSLEKLLAEKN